MNQEQIETMWKQYSASKEQTLRNELIAHYVYLVRLVAGRLSIYLNHYVEIEDLIGYGVMGLIDAIDKFDWTKNVKFETYASLRIRGAIIDEIRKLDWVPRTLRKKQKDFNKAYSALENTLGRTPTDEEAATHLDMTQEAYRQLAQESNVAALVFIEDYKVQVGGLSDEVAKQPEAKLEHEELIQVLKEGIETLSEKENKVITLYYFEELTLKEISAVLGVSESRISQIHTKAVAKLRLKLAKYHVELPL